VEEFEKAEIDLRRQKKLFLEKLNADFRLMQGRLEERRR
jgi:hypothetical protein